MRNYDPPPSCHVATCCHWFLLPYFGDALKFMGRFVWRVAQELEVPIGIMILPNLHVACFGRNNGQTMIAILHLFSSCGRNHLENLSFWRRHFMADLFGRVASAILGGHEISSHDQQQPHTYHKWRERSKSVV